MKTRIIESKLNSLDAETLRNYFSGIIYDSINSLMYVDAVSFYEDCTLDDFFAGGYEEIWDEDKYVGEGINAIAFNVVITDENKGQIEEIFRQIASKELKDYIERNK